MSQVTVTVLNQAIADRIAVMIGAVTENIDIRNNALLQVEAGSNKVWAACRDSLFATMAEDKSQGYELTFLMLKEFGQRCKALAVELTTANGGEKVSVKEYQYASDLARAPKLANYYNAENKKLEADLSEGEEYDAYVLPLEDLAKMGRSEWNALEIWAPIKKDSGAKKPAKGEAGAGTGEGEGESVGEAALAVADELREIRDALLNVHGDFRAEAIKAAIEAIQRVAAKEKLATGGSR
jgi:hypothetical protein